MSPHITPLKFAFLATAWWFSTLAAHWNHQGSFEIAQHSGPIPGNTVIQLVSGRA